MRLHLGDAGGTMIDGNTSWKTVAENALGIWNQRLAGASVKFLVVREPSNPIREGDNLNSVYFSSAVYGKPFGNGVLAVVTRRTRNGRRVEADVVFNNSVSWNSYRGNLRTAQNGQPLHDMLRVALHEFGHVIGLDHPDQNGQFGNMIMRSTVSNTDWLQADDEFGGRFLWAGRHPWRGILTPDFGTPSNLGTTASIQVKFANGRGDGVFSGKIWQNGRIIRLRGVSTQKNGTLLFGSRNGAISPLFASDLSWSLAFAWTADGLRAVFDHNPFSNTPRTSSGIVRQAQYHRTQSVPSWLLTSFKQGYYTMATVPKAQNPPMSASSYPQGIGALTSRIGKNGQMRITGILADGTKVTTSTHISVDRTPFFFSFRGPASTIRNSFFCGEFVINTALTNADIQAVNSRWFRSPATLSNKPHPYAEAWPNGIFVDIVAAKYYADPRFFTIQEAIGLGPVDWSNGNARLQFRDGKLESSLTFTDFNVNGSRIEKTGSASSDYTLKLNARTGWMSGTLRPPWSTRSGKPASFRGVILHKGQNRGGYGFFLSNRAGDFSHESGRVILSAP